MTVPTITVKLDDGTGTYPTDITSKVRLPDGMALSGFGRPDEFATSSPSTLGLVLDNADGRFTNGTVALAPGTGVRWSVTSGATSRDYFTGRVSVLDLSWPGGGQEFATVAVTAVDFLGDLSRRSMRSMVEEEILLDSPTAYYTLSEPEGSTSAGDTSGRAASPLSIVTGGPALSFGSGTGPTDGLSAVTFAGGQYLSDGGTSFVTVPTTLSMGCWFSTTTPNASLVQGQGDLGWELSINGVGEARVFVPGAGGGLITGPVVTDGLVHHVIVTADGVTATLYVDGVSVGSRAVGASSGAQQVLNVGRGFTGSISHVAIYSTAVSAVRVAAQAAARTNFAETTAARLSRLAAYAGMTATTVTASGQTMVQQDTTGQSLADAMQTVATAEGGVLFVDGSGVLTMQGRHYRSVRTTPDLVLKSDAIDLGTEVAWDQQQKINQVTVTRTGGATQAVSSADVLANRNIPVYGQSLELAVPTDTEALDAANWTLTKHEDTTPRLASVTLDLLAPDPSTTAAAILGLDLGDRISLTPMPSQLWAGAGDYTIEGWSVTLSDRAWTHTLNVLPWQLAQAWILGDAVYGVLGSTTILGY